jgi:hypothetical protein
MEPPTDVHGPAPEQHPSMVYAVVWNNGTPRPVPGSLEFAPEGIVLRGTETTLDLPYSEIRSAHVGRRDEDRVGGRLALVLELASGDVVRIASLNGPGTLNELAERLEGTADA